VIRSYHWCSRSQSAGLQIRPVFTYRYHVHVDFIVVYGLPAEGLLGLRPRPFGAALRAFNLGCAQVVEPFLFYVGGSTNMPIGAKLLSNIFLKMVPAEGFEPPTYGLQNRCTTTVLSRLGS
jgi:hypothetical protein